MALPLYFLSVPLHAHAAELTVTIQNIKQSTGAIRVGFWNKKKHFLKDDKSLFLNYYEEMYVGGEVLFTTEKVPVISIHSKLPQVSFTVDLPPGVYTFGAYHDLNNNRSMEMSKTFFIPNPQEPYCVSNDAINIFGIPTFAQAKFTVIDDDPNHASCSLLHP